MSKQFYIFIGRSGCGKGTQAELLKDYLEKEKKQPTIHITTGGGFRDFIESGSYLASISKKINETGGLQPEFLAVWNWANILIKDIKGGETILLDGSPRKIFESRVLNNAISFLGYEKPTVIYMDVKESWARERLNGRGRADDNSKEIDARMNWFEKDVVPVLDDYMHDSRYSFIHINGEQAVEEVHKEIKKKLDLSLS